jgi:FKBP-type peptidyl-prolyl cis-trans isomerase FkpA
VSGRRARVAVAALLLASAALGCPSSETRESAPEPAPAPPSAAEQQDRDSLYALGAWLARNLAGIELEAKELEPLEQGLEDALLGRALRVDPVEVGERVQGFLNERRARTAAREKQAGASFVEAARNAPGAERTVSGAIFLELAAGAGPSPTLADRVRVHFRGIRRDGSSFDDSYARNRSEELGVTRVIPCWMEALQRMRAGGKARVTCTSDLAYGDRGLAGRVLPGAPLQFELELLEILPGAESAP